MGEALGGPEVGLNGAKPEAELELIARIGVGHGAPSSCELRPRKRSAAPVCSARIVRAFDRMIQIAISEAAFAAIAKTMPLGSVGYEYESNERGERLVWLDKPVVDRLGAMRGPGESYSDVILQVAKDDPDEEKSP
jgi:hypothetical protein